MKVPYIDLSIDDKTFLEKFQKGWLKLACTGNYILGKEVSKLEQKLARICKTKYAITVANGTDALILALKSLNLPTGSEVITAPNSYLASASSIYLAGLKIKFSDVDESLNLCPISLGNTISEKTRAVIFVHYTGQSTNIHDIKAICKQRRVKLIEDSAQAFGCYADKEPVGGIGDIGCFSLHPLKVLSGIGDGGLIITNNKLTYNYLQKARNHGLKDRNNCHFWSINSRLDTINAIFLLNKLSTFKKEQSIRRKLAKKYIYSLKKYISFPRYDFNYHVFHLFIILTKNQRERNRLYKHLHNNQIDVKIHYPKLIPEMDVIKSPVTHIKQNYPNAYKLNRTMITLPLYPNLDPSKQDFVINTIKKFYEP